MDTDDKTSRWTKRRRIEAAVANDIAAISGFHDESGMFDLHSDCLLSHVSCAEFDAGTVDYVAENVAAISSPKTDESNHSGLPNQLASCDESRTDNEYIEFDDLICSDSDSESECEVNENYDYDICSLLSTWATKYNISLNSLSALLDILRPHFLDLPKDPRTLLKTPTDIEPEIRSVSNGSYYHFGIANQIESSLSMHGFDVASSQLVSTQINVDGVPLFKSTGGQFWPILGKIDTPIVSEPFVIGIFYGVTKPNNLDLLGDFVTECHKLIKDGIALNGFMLSFKISAFICDAPARPSRNIL